ncbi:MAG: hypothetical protein R3F33_10425 [Planctomycetota bacterium]
MHSRTSDSYLRLYDGGNCAAECLASQPAFEGGATCHYRVENVQVGQTVGIQYFVAGYDGPEDLNLEIVMEPDPCSGSLVDAFEPNDLPNQATNLGPGVYPGLYLSSTDRDLFRFVIPPHEGLAVWSDHATIQMYGMFYWRNAAGFFELAPPWYNMNGSDVPREIWWEPHFFSDQYSPVAEPCSAYQLNVTMTSRPCAMDDNLPGEGTCDDPHPLVDGTYIKLGIDSDSGNLGAEHFRFCVAPNSQVEIEAAFNPTDMNLRFELSWLTNGPNDDCWNGVAQGHSDPLGGVTTMTFTNQSPMVRWYDLKASSSCGPFDLLVSGTGQCASPLGPTVCSPAAVNSSGQSVTVEATGNVLRAANAVHLLLRGLPDVHLGYVMGARDGIQGSVPGVLGDSCVLASPGNRYLSTLFGLIGDTHGISVPLWQASAAMTPELAGETWTFQAIYRDWGTQQVLWSEGAKITFQ